MVLVDGFMSLRRDARFAAPADGARSKAISSFTSRRLHVKVITLLQVKIDFFNNELTLLVLLTVLVRFCVRPANHGVASFTKYVTNAMKPSDEASVFCGTHADIDAVIEKIGPALSRKEHPSQIGKSEQYKGVLRNQSYRDDHESFSK